MKKVLLALALLLAPSGAFAQCSGVFGANTVCGSVAGGPPTATPVGSMITLSLSSPPPIGTTVSNTGAFSALGIGITSPPIPFDLEAASSSAAWPNSAYIPVLGKAVSNITTDSHPTVGISRWETLAGLDTSAGQNAALFVTAFGNNTVPSSTVSQTAALTAYASQVGIGDVVGNYSISTQSGGLHSGTGYTAYSYFGAVNVTTTQGSAIAVETNVANNSGADYPLSTAAFGTGLSVGVDNVAAGTKLNSAGIWNRSNGGGQFDAGYVNLAGSVKTYGFIDQSSSLHILAATGSHTDGIDLSGATLSTFAYKSTGFLVGTTGVITGVGTNITGLPLTTGVTGILPIANGGTGINFPVAAWSATAPTVASGFCSTGSPVTALSASNGTAAFDILIGAATCGSTGTLTMPAATTGWVCNATDVTTPASHNVVQTGTQGSTTAVVLTDYARTTGIAQNFNPGDHIHVQCTGF